MTKPEKKDHLYRTLFYLKAKCKVGKNLETVAKLFILPKLFFIIYSNIFIFSRQRRVVKSIIKVMMSRALCHLNGPAQRSGRASGVLAWDSPQKLTGKCRKNPPVGCPPPPDKHYIEQDSATGLIFSTYCSLLLWTVKPTVNSQWCFFHLFKQLEFLSPTFFKYFIGVFFSIALCGVREPNF